jgi:hypothetical protein
LKTVGKGNIIEIHVHDEYYVYAQVLQGDNIAYFDAKYILPVQNLSNIDTERVLFVLGSSIDKAIRTGRWRVRGKLPINSKLQKLPLQFIQDAINPNKFSLYDCETGEITQTTREVCEGLERCAIWYDNHIEDRIYAHYNNTQCEWLLSIDEWIRKNQKK